MNELPQGDRIVEQFLDCGRFAREHGLRLSLHPDQFILLSSPDTGITERSISELLYHAEVAEWIGADVINIHGGGAYGDKRTALERVHARLDRLPEKLRSRLTFENDDRTYTPVDLLPLCRSAGVPLVYDVHHHRCLPDMLSVEEATQEALMSWPADREPMFHLSSPLDGWEQPKPQRHHDMIEPCDVPECWLELPRTVTIEVEAKAKEKAVLALADSLRACRQGRACNSTSPQSSA